MKPVAAHLKVPQEHSAFDHLLHTVTVPRYLLSSYRCCSWRPAASC